ncbi:MAG: ATP-binding protein [Pseudomonadota bacterium]
MITLETVRQGADPLAGTGVEGMTQWRERFLLTILRYAFVFGFLVGVPSVFAAARDGRWTIVVMDIVALSVAFILWRMRSWPYRMRSWSLVGMIYLLGASFLVSVGPVSQIYLMAFPVMASILLGLRAAVYALVINAVTLLAVGYLADSDLVVPGFEGMPFTKWAVIALNFTFVDALITLATAIMLQRLEASLQQQSAATLALQQEQTRLRAAYKQLMHETIERQRAEAQVRELNSELEERVRLRTAQLQSANKELESFAYTVSHDLRGPLSAIHGFSHMLEGAIGPAAGERALHSLERIKVNTRHMGELIEALLDLARLSRTPLHRQAVDLCAVAREVLAACREREPGREPRLTIPDTLVVNGDRALLHVALDNLLGNAWKFTGRQDAPEIVLGQGRAADGSTFYFVRDNGVGFDMAHSARLFGTFQRLHAPGDFPGTGIGLVTVQRIIARHGGKVWAEGSVGRGATFFFSLGDAAQDQPGTP